MSTEHHPHLLQQHQHTKHRAPTITHATLTTTDTTTGTRLPLGVKECHCVHEEPLVAEQNGYFINADMIPSNLVKCAEQLKCRFKNHFKIYVLCGMVTMATWLYLAMTSSPTVGDVTSLVGALYVYTMSTTVSLFILSCLTWIWGLVVYFSMDEWLPLTSGHRRLPHDAGGGAGGGGAGMNYQRSLLGYSVFLTGFIYMCITLDCARVLLRNFNDRWMTYTPEFTFILVFVPVSACLVQAVLTSTYLYHFLFTITVPSETVAQKVMTTQGAQ